MTVILPTVGRVLHYRPAVPEGARMITNGPDEPMAAIVAKVVSETHVNLTVFGADGVTHGRSNVLLVQQDEAAPEGESYCHWMPFQLGQAAAQLAAQPATTEEAATGETADETADEDEDEKTTSGRRPTRRHR